MGLWLKQDDGTLVEVSGGGDGGGTGADGKGWTGGTYDAATGVVTFTSDDGLEFTTGDLRGANGIDGLDGNMWHVGSGAPDPTLGEPGDYYLDGTDGWVYVKRTPSSWTNLYVNLTGPSGDDAGAHDHDYAPTSHSHNYAPPHDHPYAASSHSHSYSPTSHTHSYLPLTGGSLTGPLNVQGGNAVLNLRNSTASARPYMAFYYNGTRAGYIGYPNAASGGATYLHADSNILELSGARVAVKGAAGTEIVGPNRGESNKTYADIQFRVTSATNSGNDASNSHVGMALWARRSGIAPIMRVSGKGAGEVMGFTNNANSAFVDIWAKGLTVNSSATTKRNIKTVEDDAVISLAEKWLMAEFDRQVGPLSVRLKPEVAVRQAALLEAGEELPPVDTADYESVDHDCTLDLCDGTPESPCPIIVNHRSEWGGIAEWWGEVAPQQVVFDEEGNATGIKLEQVAATALGAVGALSRRLTDSLDRIDALEARIEAMDLTKD